MWLMNNSMSSELNICEHTHTLEHDTYNYAMRFFFLLSIIHHDMHTWYLLVALINNYIIGECYQSMD